MLDKDLNSEGQALVARFSNRMFRSAYLSLEQWQTYLVLGKGFSKSSLPACLGLANYCGQTWTELLPHNTAEGTCLQKTDSENEK